MPQGSTCYFVVVVVVVLVVVVVVVVLKESQVTELVLDRYYQNFIIQSGYQEHDCS